MRTVEVGQISLEYNVTFQVRLRQNVQEKTKDHQEPHENEKCNDERIGNLECKKRGRVRSKGREGEGGLPTSCHLTNLWIYVYDQNN